MQQPLHLPPKMIRVEEFFCFGAQGLAQELFVQPLDLGILVGEPEMAVLVQGPELFSPDAFQLHILLGNGLAASSGTAAGTGHHFHEIVMDLFPLQGLDQLPGVPQAADHGTADFFAGHGVYCVPEPGAVPQRGKQVRIRVFPGQGGVGCTESRFQYPAGGAENGPGSRKGAHGVIQRFFRQESRIQVVRPEHPDEFPGGEGQVHIGSVRPLHGGQGTFRLFGQAGHDGNAVQLFRRHLELFRQPGLGNGPEHLLRGFGGGQPSGQFRILALQEPDPAGAAAGEHGEFFSVPGLEPFQELIGLFHNGEVRPEGGVVHMVEPQLPEGRRHFPDGPLLPGQAEGFAPGRPHRRSHLDQGHFVRVRQGFVEFVRIVPFPEPGHRTVGDALAAQGAVRILDHSVPGHIHRGPPPGARHVPDVHGLDLVADLDAAHAFDAFVVVVEQGIGGGPGPAQAFGQLFLIGIVVDPQAVGQGLEPAVAAADTDGAPAVVLGQDQFHVDLPGFPDPGRMGVDHHALFDRTVAGGDHPRFSFHLHAAHPAGGDFVESFQIAQVGDLDPGLPGRFHNGGPFRHLDDFAVNGTGCHSRFLPPLKLP